MSCNWYWPKALGVTIHPQGVTLFLYHLWYFFIHNEYNDTILLEIHCIITLSGIVLRLLDSLISINSPNSHERYYFPVLQMRKLKLRDVKMYIPVQPASKPVLKCRWARLPTWNLHSYPFWWRRKWQLTPVLHGESHRQRNLMGYSPRDHKSRTRLSN